MSFEEPSAQVLAEIGQISTQMQEELAFRTNLEHAKALIAKRGILPTIVSSGEHADCARSVLYDAFKAVLGGGDIARIEAKTAALFVALEKDIEHRIHKMVNDLAGLRDKNVVDSEQEMQDAASSVP